MGIRRTYHFNCDTAGRRDGIYIKDPCDFHFRQLSGYDVAPYGIDCDATSRLQLGDRAGSRPNSGSLPVEIQGGFHERKVVVSSTPYTVTADDNVLFVDSGGGNRTLNLPAISTVAGKILKIKKIALANFVTLTPNGADTIEGTLSSYVLGTLYRTVYLYADSTANTWYFLTDVRAIQNVYSSYSPSASTSSASYVTLYTSASIFFSGRPVFFSLNGTFWDNNASDELFIEILGIRFDAGSDTDVCKAITTFHDKNGPFSGSKILTPTRGNHTVDIRAKRDTGAGTFKQDFHDFITLDMIDL